MKTVKKITCLMVGSVLFSGQFAYAGNNDIRYNSNTVNIANPAIYNNVDPENQYKPPTDRKTKELDLRVNPKVSPYSSPKYNYAQPEKGTVLPAIPSIQPGSDNILKDGFFRPMNEKEKEMYPNKEKLLPNTVPDAINFFKLNKLRNCSPAEKYKGKTECRVCDPDVPHITHSDTRLAEKYGGRIIYSDVLSYYRGDNAYSNSKETGSRYSYSSWGRSHYNTPYSLLEGYHLTGRHPEFAPINMRSVCEMLKPAAIKQGKKQSEIDQNKGLASFAGAAIFSMGGLSIKGGSKYNPDRESSSKGLGDWGKFINSGGNKGTNTGMGMGSGGGSMGSGMSMPATEAFACLEFHTGSNPSMNMGEGMHLRLNPNASQKCDQPLNQYFQTKVNEIYCGYYPCDGISDGFNYPGTVALRKMFLMTNPYYMFGMTAMKSMQIATCRPFYKGGPLLVQYGGCSFLN